MRIAAFCAALGLLVYFAGLPALERRLVYPFDPTQVAPSDPRLVERRIATDDGESMVLWQADAAAGRPTILYLHGNAGNLNTRQWRFSQFVDAGYGVMAPAHRGSSGSTGKPSEATLTSDAFAVAATLSGTPFILYGESLGTGLATKLAAAGLGDAVILESPYTSFVELADVHYPGGVMRRLVTQHWDSLAHVSGVMQPLLVLHGEAGRVVPFAMGQRMFAAAGSPHKDFVPLPDTHHHLVWAGEGRAAIFRFLNQQ